MNNTQLIESLGYLMKAGIPAYIQGSPGIGKSQTVKQFADSVGYNLITQSAAIMDPTDAKGLPGLDKETKTAKWFAPYLLHQVRENPKTIIFFDDLPTATVSVQASLFRTILDNCIGDEPMPDTVYRIGAGNRATDAAGANQMLTPMRNRFAHLMLEPEVLDWSRWAVHAGVHTAVIAFLRLRNELFNVFDKTKYAFPTPRTWSDMVSPLLNENPPKGLLLELVGGLVGREPAAIEFCAFYDMYKSMPSLEHIITTPGTAEVPTIPAVLYAVSTALGRRASQNNMDAVVQYACRMPAEFSILTVTDAARRDVTVTKTRAYITWAVNNQDVLM